VSASTRWGPDRIDSFDETAQDVEARYAVDDRVELARGKPGASFVM
jgi:hypothetical protein